MKYKEFFQSNAFRTAIVGLGTTLVAALIFFAGVKVGYYKAAFSYRLGDNYHRMFGQREGRMHGISLGGFMREEFTEAHGVAGKIVSVDLPTFMVAGRDGIEKTVFVRGDTLIKKFRDTATSTDLLVGNEVVILGTPNENSEIEAKLIRIMPLEK